MQINYFTAHQLCKRWSLVPKTLEKWRYKGIGPKYVKVGGRILYPMQDVLSFESQGLYAKINNKPDAAVSRTVSSMEASV